MTSKKITKTQLIKETAKMWNNVREVHGFTIVRVCWQDEAQYMIVKKDELFQIACKPQYVPIDYFRTQKDLVDNLYNKLNV